MKKITLLLSALFLFGVTFGQVKKYPPKVIIIGVGEKNPTFNEAQFPHIKFYYTPKLKPANESISEAGNAALSLLESNHIYKGEPEFVRNYWNLISSNKTFMLFDKESRCYTIGPDLLRRSNDINNAICSNDKTLGDNVKAVIKKEKTVKQNKKSIDLVQPDNIYDDVSISIKNYYKKFRKTMVGNKLPDFNIVDVKGNPTTINAVINNEPTLVLFFELPKNLDVNKYKDLSKEKNVGKFATSILSGNAAASLDQIFLEIESQIFKYDAREK